MKTVKGSTIKLNQFQETISLVYGIDANTEKERLTRIEREATILYYLSDMQYTILKRNLETALNHPLTDEEMTALLCKPSLPIKELSLSVLTKEDLRRIMYDTNYLGKYNELYPSSSYSKGIMDTLTNIYAHRLDVLTSDEAFLDNVKKHQIMVKLGIEPYLKNQNKTLETRLAERRLAKQGKNDSIAKIVCATVAKSNIR